MGYTLTKIGKDYNYELKEFFCDSEDDIETLPTSATEGPERCLPGSKATLANGDEYFLNTSNDWIKKKTAAGSGSGGSVEIDNTLTQEGQAADAKAVGDALANKADSSALSSYVQTSVAESTYAKKSDLTSKADSADLANYVQTSTAESTYAKKTDLSAKADVSALSSYLQSSTAESTYAKKSEIPSKGAAVADAGDSDVKDKLNALLASLRTAGVIATE